LRLTCAGFERLPYVNCKQCEREGCLYTHRPLLDEREEEQAENRQTSSLFGIVIILLLLVIGLFLVRQLRTSAAIEDCLLSGRTNCDTVVSTQN
jgi:hypothetical protein